MAAPLAGIRVVEAAARLGAPSAAAPLADLVVGVDAGVRGPAPAPG